MAKAKLHTIKLNDLQVLALSSATPAITEKGSLLGSLLDRAFNEAKEQLEEIAKREILGSDSIAPADEFDNPEQREELPTEAPNGKVSTQVDNKKTEEKGSKGKNFVPSID